MQECDIMPEGPEVKKITEKLNQSLAGKTITQIDIVDESIEDPHSSLGFEHCSKGIQSSDSLIFINPFST